MSAEPLLQPLSPLGQLRAPRLPRRLAQLAVGLFLFGFSMAMQVRAVLGLAPWDVLAEGLSHHLPLSFGAVTVVVALAVLLLWIPLRQMPGLGTVANALLVGVAADFGLWAIPEQLPLAARIGLLLGGVTLNGFAAAVYLGAQLGPGPRDGLMTGLHRVTGRSMRLMRTCIEVVVLALGWLLGGTVGLGTLLYALAIGPLIQFFLPLVVVRLPPPAE